MSSGEAPQLLSDIKAVPVEHTEVLTVVTGSNVTAAEPIKKTSGVRCVAQMLSICSTAVNGRCKTLLSFTCGVAT